MLLQLPPRTVDVDGATVHGTHGDVALTPTETALLARLAAAEGAPVSRDALLADVWGYAPQALTRTVDTTVRRLRKKIEDNASDPRWLLTVYGQGYRLATAHPEPATDEAVPHEPARPTVAVLGREQALHEVRGALEPGHVVTLTGPAGVGKTRLAQAIGGPTWFVSLAEATTAADIVRRVAEAVGAVVKGEDAGQSAAHLGALLARREPRVLVLDNLEQAVEAASVCVPEWRDAGLSVLVTSQVRLALDGETVFRLGPLGDDDGATLLLRRAQALGHWHTVDPADPVLRDLSRRLDGLPLALELAAARSNLFRPADLLARMENALQLLRHGRRDAPARHGALGAALDWSWELLSDDHGQALAWLSTVRGGVAPTQAIALLEQDGRSLLDAEEALHTLVERSLVRVLADTPVRLGLFEVVRQYGDAQLGDGREEARKAHRGVFLDVVESAAAAGDLSTLSQELDNVLAPGPKGDDAGRVRAILAVDGHFAANGPHRLHEQLLEEAVALADGLPVELRARALHAHAAMLVQRGALERAGQALDRAAQAANTSEAQARVLVTRGRREMALGTTDGLALAEKAETLAVSASLRASIDMLQGEIHQAAGHPLPAEALCRRAVERAAEAGLPEREAAGLTVLGNVLADLGRNEEALASHRTALATYRQLGAERREAAALSNVGNLLLAMGHADEAMEAYDEVLSIVRRRGQELDEAVALTNAGCALIQLERAAEAEVALSRSARIHERAGIRRGQGIALGNLAIARELDGRGTVADYTAALDCVDGVDRRAASYFLAYRGGLRLERGEGGSDDLDRARELVVGMGDPAVMQVIALCRARGGEGVEEALRGSEGLGNADVHQAHTLLLRMLQV